MRTDRKTTLLIALLAAATCLATPALALDPPSDDLFDFLGEIAPFPNPDEARDRDTWAGGLERNANELEDLLKRARMFHDDATFAHQEIVEALEPISRQQDPGDVAFVLGQCEAAEARAGEAGQKAIEKGKAAKEAADEACRLADAAASRGDVDGARSARTRASSLASEAGGAASLAKDAAEEAGALAKRLAKVAPRDEASVDAARARAEAARAKLTESLAGLRKIESQATRTVDGMEGEGADLVAEKALERARAATAEISRLTAEVLGFSRSAKQQLEAAKDAEASAGSGLDPKKVEGLAASAEFAAGFAARESELARSAAQRAEACVDRAWARVADDSRRADTGGGAESDDDFDEFFDDIEGDAFAGMDRAGDRQEERGRRDRDRVRSAAAEAARDADEYTRGVREEQRDSYDDFTRRVGDEIAIASAEQERRRQRERASGSGSTSGFGTGRTGGTTSGQGGTRVGSAGGATGGTTGAAPNRFFLTCSKWVSCEMDRLARQGLEPEDVAEARASLASVCPPIFNKIGFPSKSECVSGCKENSHPDTHRSCECICT